MRTFGQKQPPPRKQALSGVAPSVKGSCGSSQHAITPTGCASSGLRHDFSQIPTHSSAIPTIQRKPANDDYTITKPTFIQERRGNTDRIEDAYGAGSLNKTEWGELLDIA